MNQFLHAFYVVTSQKIKTFSQIHQLKVLRAFYLVKNAAN